MESLNNIQFRPATRILEIDRSLASMGSRHESLQRKIQEVKSQILFLEHHVAKIEEYDTAMCNLMIKRREDTPEFRTIRDKAFDLYDQRLSMGIRDPLAELNAKRLLLRELEDQLI